MKLKRNLFKDIIDLLSKWGFSKQGLFNNSKGEMILELPSLGTKFFKVKNYTGSISFESNLPICRPLLFKNPAPNFEGNFDVFHS